MNLSFDSTGLTVIVGKSGCGKTTLLNMIGTMDQDYIGSIEFDGVELSTLSYNKMSDYRNYDSAFIFQINSLFEHLSVRENIQMVLDLQNKQTDIGEILDRVGLKGFEDKKVKALSGGERQRVGIARALAKNCKIILADEPTSALDSKNAHKILALLKEVSKDKLVIVVTHDTKKAVHYADRFIKLVDGRVVEDSIVNEKNGDAMKIKKMPSKKRLMLPIFWYQFRKTLFINLFIVLLCSLAVAVAAVAREQKFIRDEYEYFETDKPQDFSPLKTLTAHYGNDLDLYHIVRATETDNAFTYLQEVSNKNGGLDNYDLELLAQQLKAYNLHFGNAEYGNIIIDGVSQVLKQNVSYQGIVYYWDEPQRSYFTYYQYDEKNNYNLRYGSLPQSDDEILITDTIADSYLNRNDLSSDDLSVMVGQELTIKDIYHKIDGYYYTIPKTFTISGIIETNQLQYFNYNHQSRVYNFLPDIVQQSRFDPYMNPAFMQPYGYVVLKNHLDAYQTTKYYFTNFMVDAIRLMSVDQREFDSVVINNRNIATFHGVDDYRGILTAEDNLSIDRLNRLIITDPTGDKLEGNQIVVTRDFLTRLFPEKNLTTRNQVITEFNLGINGSEVTLQIDGLRGTKEVTLEIVGVANSTSSTYMYVSEEMYNALYEHNLPYTYPSLTVGLDNIKPIKRIELMESLYRLGYVLIPVNQMPGPYMQFVTNQGIIEIEDDEGFPEVVNMSVHHLFSKYYNTAEMNEINSALEIVQSVATFCVLMSLFISMGFVYLKERRQKDYTTKLSALGVQTKHIIRLNVLNYVVMAALIGILSYVFTKLAIDMINNIFILRFFNDEGEIIASIARFRVIMTNTTTTYAVLATIVALIIGITSTAIFTYRSRK